MDALSKILTYFRVKDWLHLLGFAFLGFAFNPNGNLFSPELASIVLLSVLLLAFAYSFNTQYELHMGKKELKKQIAPSLVILAASLVYSITLSFTIFFLALFSILIVFVYEVPPLRLKGTPIMVTLLNAAGFTIHFLLGYAMLSNLDSPVLIFSLFIALVMLPIQLVHEIAHYWQDKKEGLVTTSIRFGIRRTRSIIDAFLVLLIFWSLFLYARIDLPLIFLISMIIFSFSFFFIMRVEKNAIRARMHIRYLGMALGMMLLFVFRIF